eukprot:6653718-Prymnesium_polylepis.1
MGVPPCVTVRCLIRHFAAILPSPPPRDLALSLARSGRLDRRCIGRSGRRLVGCCAGARSPRTAAAGWRLRRWRRRGSGRRL